MLCLHDFSGCDVTGRFSAFSKTTCFDTSLESDSIVHKGFASLGNNDDGLKEEIIDGLTKFVLDFVSAKKTIKYKYFAPITLVFIFEISIRFWKATSYVFCSSFHHISKSSCVQHLEKVIFSSSIVSKSWRIWLVWYQQQLLWSGYDRLTTWSKWIWIFKM